jgi:uncharacterized protein
VDFVKRVGNIFPKSDILWLLHGGEPLLKGKDWFQRFIVTLRNLSLHMESTHLMAIQTNATLIDEEWLSIFASCEDLFSERCLGISVDGPASINNLARLSPNGIAKSVVPLLPKIREIGFTFGTLSVIGQHNVHEAQDLVQFLHSLNPDYIKFIPCFNFDTIGNPERLGISPLEYSRFCCDFFDIWFSQSDANYATIMVDPISTIISNLVGHQFHHWCEWENEKCENFLTVFPNGDLWLCCTFDHCFHRDVGYIGNACQLTDEELTKALMTPVELCYYNSFRSQILSQCDGCSAMVVCHGGCLAQRDILSRKSPRLSKEYCEGRHMLINHIQKALNHINQNSVVSEMGKLCTLNTDKI